MAKPRATQTKRWLPGFAAVLILCFVIPAAGTADKDATKIEGVWRVESVKLAGQDVPGLEGAELTLLPEGKKTFKLPSGVVEKGTYALDAKKDPPHIDST